MKIYSNSNYKQQEGAVLLMSLVLLIVLTLLGISALDSTKLETKMTANNRLEHTVFQTANAGIDNTYSHYKLNEGEIPNDFKTTTKDKLSSLGFNNHTGNSVHLNKVTDANNSAKSFYIVESIGCSSQNTSTIESIKNCDGKQITLREGWMIEGAEKNKYVDGVTAKCFNALIPECQAPLFLAIDAECPTCKEDFAGCSYDSVPEGNSYLPPDCQDVFMGRSLIDDFWPANYQDI